MRERRQIGFIKNYSNKPINTFKDQPSEFSYFKVKNGKHDDEFSPYKIQQEQPPQFIKTVAARCPPLPGNSRWQGESIKRSIGKVLQRVDAVQKRDSVQKQKNNDKKKADQLYDRIKQNIVNYESRRNSSRQKLQQNIGGIRNKIEELDNALKELKINKQSLSKGKTSVQNKSRTTYQFQQNDFSSSSDESSQVVIKSIPSPKISQQKLSKMQKNNWVEGDVSESSSRAKDRDKIQQKQQQIQEVEDKNEEQQEESQFNHYPQPSSSQTHNQKVITLNSRNKNQPPLQIEQYSSSSDDQESNDQQIHPLPSEAHRTFKNQEKHNVQLNIQTKDYFKNKGGVCFQVDVKDFTQPIPPPKQQYQPNRQKKGKIDKKAQLLKRREAAKVYDKLARRALFSPNH